MKRIFVSFAIEDRNLRDMLIGQMRNANSPFEFVDMSVKEPWDSSWKTKCRTKIKGCDGMIAIITKNTAKADGQVWEIKCAKEENVPVLAIYGKNDEKHVTVPSECGHVRIVDWTWENISNWLKSL